jgi:predicted MFS family arabinose efflux permease
VSGAAFEKREAAPGESLARATALRSFMLLIGAGWLGTNLAYAIVDLPLNYLLKDGLRLGPEAVAGFFFIGQFTNYIKPLAGVLTDALPFFGTRRRHYLLLGLIACGVMWLVLPYVPRTYVWLLATYSFLHVFIVLISTVLGGVMVEGGERFSATGRLSSQRIGIFRLVEFIGGPLGGWLSRFAFALPASITAALHFLLVPLFWRQLKEAPTARRDTGRLEEVARQARVLASSRPLWGAVGLVFLVMVEPGFNTPLFYYQTNTLKFTPTDVGWLKSIGGLSGVLGAYLYSRICRGRGLRPLVVAGILTHVVAAMLYLLYRDWWSAVLITVLYSGAQALALLPFYDLAMRATPRGSEALGYSIMMSIWNFATQLGNVVGSALMDHLHISFSQLVVINAATTAVTILALPLLPRALTDRREGEPTPPSEPVEVGTVER